MTAKLSKDAVEALILIGGFALVALIGLAVFFIWPASVYGAWRVLLTVVVGAVIAIPAMIAVRKRLLPPSR